MNKKFQIFISSTYLDLQEERKNIANVIKKHNHIAVGMETFPAGPVQQWEMIKEMIDDCDYYVLIIGGRYGSISPPFDPDDQREISYTQREYEYAYKQGIPIYTFFRQDIDKLPPEKRERNEKKRKMLKAFIEKVRNNGYYHETWQDVGELGVSVLNSLTNAFTSTPRPGWVRSDRLFQTAMDYSSDVEIVEKLIYYKFLHLSDKTVSAGPLYRKFVKRLNTTIDVYDEYLTFRVSKFNKLVTRFRSYDSTRGTAVEVNSLIPFIMSLRDTDKTIEENPQILQPLIGGPSNVFVTSSHYYNGFQDGNKDAAAKADKNAQTVRLVVDFTSVKDYHLHISGQPRGFFSYHEESGKLVSREVGDIKTVVPGLYWIERKDMREGEVIRMEFSTDIETISNIT
ncbi:DUF4062 domain-containing protein [Dyadobacter fermentans]|uniref:DUF4062 domain-containing protein n=1 Tax=Dyadobacter fermentans (strain ATCC 700827 / DSM 18053 / CIP 107007 / KCTC 52180 / NS114) TaxID=471854 RepID=C6VUD3_DYAFD|nr:DUF4062 domain-containing protein [Dyadobacter fermentans]ACT96615.1 hypothetical protein Dfer_5422 [Dyadobacter fermentans DSM 18053]